MERKKFSDYYHIVDMIALVWNLFQNVRGDIEAYIYIYNAYEFCWPMYTDLGQPGDTFAVAGDRAI